MSEADGLADVADDELMAAVAARLPRYLLSRAIVRSPLAAAAAVLIGIAAVQGGGTEPTAASPTASTVPAPATTTAPTPTLSTTIAPPVARSSVPSFGPAAVPPTPTTSGAPAVGPTPDGDGGEGGGGGGGGPMPIDCAARPLLDLTGPLLQTLKTLVAVVPSTSTQIVLEAATGCAAGDPPILLLGVLVEFGSALPRLGGFEVPPLDVPYIPLPRPVLDAMAPAWPAVEPVCTAVGLLPLIALLGLEPYPGGLDAVGLTAINQIVNLCAQLAPS